MLEIINAFLEEDTHLKLSSTMPYKVLAELSAIFFCLLPGIMMTSVEILLGHFLAPL